MRSRRGAIATGACLIGVVAVVGLLLRAHAMSGPVEDAVPPARPAANATSAARTATAPGLEGPDAAGCAPQDLADRPSGSSLSTDPIVGGTVDGGQVCAYVRGQLVGGHRLTATQATALAGAANAAPNGVGPEGLGCPVSYDYMDGYAEPHWTVRLGHGRGVPTDLWVYGNVCHMSAVSDGNARFVRLTEQVTSLLTTYVPDSRHFPAADLTAPPGPVPSGRLTDAECPDGIVTSQPDWFGGEPVAANPTRRAIRMSRPLMRAFPRATLRFAGRTETTEEQSWVLPSGRRVGWFAFERVAVGKWSLHDWQYCSWSKHPIEEKPHGG